MEFPGKSEPINLSRDNLSREVGHVPQRRARGGAHRVTAMCCDAFNASE